MVDISLGSDGDILPEKNDLIGLIDADTIAFAAAEACQYEDHLLDRDMYTNEEWLVIINEPGYDEENNLVWRINIDEAISHCMNKISRIMDKTGCKHYHLHFTAGRES